MARVLVIDDDPGVRESMARMLRQAGYAVQVADSGEQGLVQARGGGFDVIISDMRMPGLSGLDVLRTLREARVDASFIVMTGFGTVDSAVEAMKLGALDFVQKPFFRDELLMRVKAAAERRQLARQVDLLQRQIQPGGSLDALVGESDAMVRVRDLICRAAAAPGTVLITGETGTGKELAARAIHTASSRSARPFVALNCAALAESLLENELFGHARGAFTGAASSRAGLIEHASGARGSAKAMSRSAARPPGRRPRTKTSVRNLRIRNMSRSSSRSIQDGIASTAARCSGRSCSSGMASPGRAEQAKSRRAPRAMSRATSEAKAGRQKPVIHSCSM